MPGRHACKPGCRCFVCMPETQRRANAVPRKRGRAARPVAERFWEKVQKSDGCWLWTGGTNYQGYGWFVEVSQRRGERGEHLAHRMAYKLGVGPIPEGLFICHSCDNRLCVRPDHLFAGTHADNMRDMKEKGRAVSPRSRWTHCMRGHPLEGDNVVIAKSTGYRKCRICKNAYQRGQGLLRATAGRAL